jgi:hypothetical protein
MSAEIFLSPATTLNKFFIMPMCNCHRSRDFVYFGHHVPCVTSKQLPIRHHQQDGRPTQWTGYRMMDIRRIQLY